MTTRSPRHAILIGATGMLADAASSVASRASETTLIARALTRMRRVAPDALHIACDWSHPDAFAEALTHAELTHGPADLIVAWIHSGHSGVWDTLLATARPGALLVEVVGSASLDPSRGDLSHEDAARRAGLTHVTAALGYALEPGGRARWLTHSEISAGVLDAVRNRVDTVVGESSPWPPPF